MRISTYREEVHGFTLSLIHVMHLTSDVFAAPAFYEEALATCAHSSPPGRVSKLPPKITRGPSSIVQTLKTHLIVEGLPIQLLIEIRFRHVLELDMLKVVRCEDAHPHQWLGV